MTAEEFLKKSSPDNQFGLRVELEKHRLRGMVEREMESYASHVLQEYKKELEEWAEKLMQLSYQRVEELEPIGMPIEEDIAYTKIGVYRKILTKLKEE